MSSQESFRLEVVGGAGIIGANNMLYIEDDRHDFVAYVDSGANPADQDLESRKNSSFLKRAMEIARGNARRGVQEKMLLTHAHHDHIGDIALFFKQRLDEGIPLPLVIGSSFTIRLLQGAIEPMLRFEEEVRSSEALSDESIEIVLFPSIELAPGGKVNFGRVTVQAIPVVHSSPGCYGYLFKHKVISNGKYHDHRMFITGDYKTIPVDDYQELRNIDYLITDGTSVVRHDSVDEHHVSDEFNRIFAETPMKNKIFVGVISTNIERTASVVRAAYVSKRIPGVFGASLVRNYEIAINLDKECIMPRSFEARNTKFSRLPVNAIVSTGVWAQGFVPREKLDAMNPSDRENAIRMMAGISKLATGLSIGQFYNNGVRGGVKIERGDVVLISGSIYEFVYTDLLPMLQQLEELGARVIVDNTAPHEWGYERAILSAGGHGSFTQVEEVVQKTNPKTVSAYYIDEERVEVIEGMARSNNSDVLRLKNGDVVEIDIVTGGQRRTMLR